MNRTYAEKFAENGRMKIKQNLSGDEMIDSAIRRAFGDATGHVLHTPVGFDKAAAKQEAFEILRQRLEKLPEDPNQYDLWHRETCSAVRAPYVVDGKSFMTYGISTKWVNMTLKYLYLFQAMTDSTALDDPVFARLSDALEHRVHVPIDTYILEAIAANPKKCPAGLPPSVCNFRMEILNKDGTYGYYLPSKSLAWSRYDFPEDEWDAENDEYHRIQNRIRAEVGDESILDWETRVWLAAKERRVAMEEAAKQRAAQKKEKDAQTAQVPK